MSESGAGKFSCDSCKRSFLWKESLAGKQVKCKCGATIAVPQQMPLAQEDDLYDLAEDAAPPKKAAPVIAVTAVVPATASAASTAGARSNIPLAYQRGPTARERENERQSKDALTDPRRDYYVPTALLIGGMFLYVLYYAVHYHLGATGVALTGIGLGIMTAFKAVLLVGFALMVAGPLGVGFGGIWTATLKLAAIAVFCDGVTTWIDALVGGGGGFFGFGIISFPIALGIYWGLMIYLFSMDPGDSWLVVVILSIFDRIVRFALIMILLNLVLSWGGAAMSSGGGGGGGSSAAVSNDPLAAEVDDLADSNSLAEAKEYFATGNQAGLKTFVDDWYAAGCANVWFVLSRGDINGRRTAEGIILELPTTASQRAKCCEILKKYYDAAQIRYTPDDLKDEPGKYRKVELR
jgi:hypothetical protein